MSQVRDKSGQLAENVYWFPADEQIDNLTVGSATAVAVPTRDYRRIVRIVASNPIELRNTNSADNAKAYPFAGGNYNEHYIALEANQQIYVIAVSGNNRTVYVATVAKVTDSVQDF